jgi:hypothetical protein
MSWDGLEPVELMLRESETPFRAKRIPLGDEWRLERVGAAYLLRSATQAVELPAERVRYVLFRPVTPAPSPEAPLRTPQPQTRGKRP